MYVCMYTIFKILQITSIEQLLLLIIIMTIINFFLKYKKESIDQSINQFKLSINGYFNVWM